METLGILQNIYTWLSTNKHTFGKKLGHEGHCSLGAFLSRTCSIMFCFVEDCRKVFQVKNKMLNKVKVQLFRSSIKIIFHKETISKV